MIQKKFIIKWIFIILEFNKIDERFLKFKNNTNHKFEEFEKYLEGLKEKIDKLGKRLSEKKDEIKSK